MGGEFLFMRQLGSDKIHCSVITRNSYRVLHVEAGITANFAWGISAWRMINPIPVVVLPEVCEFSFKVLSITKEGMVKVFTTYRGLRCFNSTKAWMSSGEGPLGAGFPFFTHAKLCRRPVCDYSPLPAVSIRMSVANAGNAFIAKLLGASPGSNYSLRSITD